MGSLIVKLKILPSDAAIKPPQLLEEVKKKLPHYVAVQGSQSEPIAFGLEALYLDVKVDEQEGVLDKLESAIRRCVSAGEVEVKGVSRAQTRLKGESLKR